jgi:hypothetical protein
MKHPYAQFPIAVENRDYHHLSRSATDASDLWWYPSPDRSLLILRSTDKNLDGLRRAKIMTTADLEILRANVDKVIKIISRDGEALLVKVVLVSDDDQDVVYELVSTTRESQYEKFDEQPAYRITFQEIESVETVVPG